MEKETNKIIMFTTPDCQACKMVKASGLVEELNIEVIDIVEKPEAKPEVMTGAPHFQQRTVDNTTVHHTGWVNKGILRSKGFTVD